MNCLGTVDLSWWIIGHRLTYWLLMRLLSSQRTDTVSDCWGFVFMNYTHSESVNVYFFSVAATKISLCMIDDRQYMGQFPFLHLLLVIQTHLSVVVVKWK